MSSLFMAVSMVTIMRLECSLKFQVSSCTLYTLQHVQCIGQDMMPSTPYIVHRIATTELIPVKFGWIFRVYFHYRSQISESELKLINIYVQDY